MSAVRPRFSFWVALEAVPGPAAVEAVWRRWLGDDTEVFCETFLQPATVQASAVPCPRDCGCEHAVIPGTAGAIWGVCQCESGNCPDLRLTEAEVVIWEASWPKLARALCHAFELRSRFLDIGIPGTFQVGAWSADAVPVFLALHCDRAGFRRSVTELAARIHRRFILFAPTNSHLDAASQECLERAEAKCFALEHCAVLTGSGSLSSRVTPGQLLAAFSPAVPAQDEDIARRVFAVVRQLDTGLRLKPPSLLTVFRLYCEDHLPAAQIARRCNCAKSTILARLNLIEQRTGCKPGHLRRMSSHLEKAEASLSDSRARRIHRQASIYGEQDGDGENE